MRLLGYDVEVPNVSLRLSKRSDALTSDLRNPTEWLIRAISGAAESATGIRVTPLRALGVAAVFACVRVRADAVSTIPLEVHQRQGRKRRVATEHPLFRILNKRPHIEMSSADWRWAVDANASLQASGFSEIIRSGRNGRVIGLYPVESSRVTPERDAITRALRYRVLDPVTDKSDIFNVEDLLHIKSNTFNGVGSVHTTLAARECIALALAMQDNASKFFGNGSRPNGVLRHPMSLSADAQKRLKEQFEESAAGQNLYRLLMLEEGLEYVATRSENKDSQFLESKDAQNLEICRVFGVPPHKIGITGSQPRANIEEENIAFVSDVLRPICVKWEMEMDAKLFTEEEQNQGYCTYFDLDALMRGNRLVRYQSYAIGRQWGILTTNDCRAQENLDDVAGGDVLLQPVNMIDARKATEYQMATKAAGQQVTEKEGGNGGTPNANE